MKLILLIVSVFTFLACPLFAQEEISSKKVQTQEKSKTGKRDYQAALAAKQKGEFEKALILLEKAYFKENNALYLFERAIVLSEMGEKKLALGVLDENTEAMNAHPDINNFSLVREQIANKEVESNEPIAASKNLVGPILTGVGAATVITGVVLIILSKSASGDIICNTDTLEKSECKNPTPAFEKEEQARFDSANTTNIIGWSVTAAGLALTSFGAYFWLSDTTSVSTIMQPLNNNVSVQIKTTW